MKPSLLILSFFSLTHTHTHTHTHNAINVSNDLNSFPNIQFPLSESNLREKRSKSASPIAVE